MILDFLLRAVVAGICVVVFIGLLFVIMKIIAFTLKMAFIGVLVLLFIGVLHKLIRKT